MEVPLVKNRRTTQERIEKFISDLYFTDVNLFGRLYPKKCEVQNIQHWAAPSRVPFVEAEKAAFSNFTLGSSVGPAWSTHWFKLNMTIPAEWQGLEVRLRFGCGNAEAMVWKDGQPVQGLTHQNARTDFILTENCGSSPEDFKHELYIEVACTELLGVGGGGMIQPPDAGRSYTLNVCELSVRDAAVFSLLTDLQLLLEVSQELPECNHRGTQALHVANHIVNLIVGSGSAAYERAHQLATEFFAQKNGEGQHVIHAVGNCHIDTAWLWPYAETRRKTARSFSTTLKLLQQFPEMTFVASQAQQFAWLKEDYPGLFSRIQEQVKTGRFIPVGGTWVETDGLLPSGESFIRQFLLGQQFFMKEFEVRCKEFWLPDTFGYSAQLPQIMRHCDISRFLTQKLSWSLVNKFPHHSFHWEGIDGSSVLAHFPPGEKYTMTGEVKQLLKTSENHSDKGRSDCSMYLYGYGDGGQGPSEMIMERLMRLKDVNPLPRVDLSSPNKYFEMLERDAHKLNTWCGELYLELHNGTYTTHAQVKALNRRCEFALRDCELWSSLAACRKPRAEGGASRFPEEELRRLWHLLLLNQFHDVLPGTSIHAVYDDTLSHYDDILKTCQRLTSEAFLCLSEGTSAQSKASAGRVCLANSFGWARREVISSSSRKELMLVEVDGFSVSPVNSASLTHGAISVKQNGDVFILENKYLRAEVDALCRIRSLLLRREERETVRKGGLCNQLVLYDDVPLFWDAWDVMDYHIETGSPVTSPLKEAHVTCNSSLRVCVTSKLRVGTASSVTVTVQLDADSPYLRVDCKADWHEKHKFLKAEFALSPHSHQATYDIQMGYLNRSTHRNTSWDWAKFEVCGHKWADVSEHGFGVALLNDCKYGFSTHTASGLGTLCLSLLRSPKAPDAEADMGHHNFSYALLPHTGSFQEAGVIQQAYNFNNPLRAVPAALNLLSAFKLSNPAVVLETVKMSEDGAQDVILRLYESFGGHARLALQINCIEFASVRSCNGLEEAFGPPLSIGSARTVTLQFSPFQIQTLRLVRSDS